MARPSVVERKTLRDPVTGKAIGIAFWQADNEANRFELYFDQFNATVTAEIIAHGLRAKVGDGAALGKDMTNTDKFNSAKAIADKLLAGVFVSRETGVSSKALNATEILIEAVARVKPHVERSKVEAFVASKDKAGLAELRANSKIAAAIADIKAEQSKTVIDTDQLLGELED